MEGAGVSKNTDVCLTNVTMCGGRFKDLEADARVGAASMRFIWQGKQELAWSGLGNSAGGEVQEAHWWVGGLWGDLRLGELRWKDWKQENTPWKLAARRRLTMCQYYVEAIPTTNTADTVGRVLNKFPQLVDTLMSWWSLILWGQSACNQQAVDTIGRLWDGLIGVTLCRPVCPVLTTKPDCRLHDSISMHKTVRVNKRKQTGLSPCNFLDVGRRGRRRGIWEMARVYPKQADYSAYNSWSLRFRVNEERKERQSIDLIHRER